METKKEPARRKSILVWPACGQTADEAVEEHLLRFPEHRGPGYEVTAADWDRRETEAVPERQTSGPTPDPSRPKRPGSA